MTKHKTFRLEFGITHYEMRERLVKHLHNIAYEDIYVQSALLVIATWLILKTLPRSTTQKGLFSSSECVQLWWLHIGSLMPSTALDDTPWRVVLLWKVGFFRARLQYGTNAGETSRVDYLQPWYSFIQNSCFSSCICSMYNRTANTAGLTNINACDSASVMLHCDKWEPTRYISIVCKAMFTTGCVRDVSYLVNYCRHSRAVQITFPIVC